MSVLALVPSLARLGRNTVRVCKDTYREMERDKVGQMAAALTYHTLFSLLPTLVLAMVLLQVFVQDEQRQQFKDAVVQTILPATHAARAGAANAAELKEAREELAGRVGVLLDQLEGFHFGGIGVVGLIVFIYGATALLATVERSFNNILGIVRARPWYLRLVLYYAVITLAPLPLIAGQVVQLELLEIIGADSWLAWPAIPLAALLPFSTAWIVFFLLYLLLPNASMPRHAAAIGAVGGALGWALVKEGFRVYVANAAVANFYGALALLPLFLLWLWLSWFAILAGLELARSIAARSRASFRPIRLEGGGAIDPLWLLPVAAAVAAGHEEADSIDAVEAARATGLAEETCRSLLQVLAEGGIIVAVEKLSKADLTSFLPARPASSIRVAEILALAPKLASPALPGGPAIAPAWDTAEVALRAARDAVGDKTLAEMVARRTQPSPPPMR